MFSFTVKIDGENVSPETVALEDLLFTLGELRDAIVASAVDSGEKKKKIFLSLKGVTKKCNLLTIVENESAHVGTVKVAKAIRLRDFSIIPPQARIALKKLWGKARNRNWTIAVQNGQPEAIIDPAVGAPTERYVRGSTTIFARVIRVGGTRPTVLLQMPNGDKRTFDVAGEEVAQQLGGNLYRRLVLHGDARWLAGSNNKLADFRVKRVGPYNDKTANPAEAMKALSQIMGHRWDGVNPEEFIQDERSDD